MLRVDAGPVDVFKQIVLQDQLSSAEQLVDRVALDGVEATPYISPNLTFFTFSSPLGRQQAFHVFKQEDLGSKKITP